ncbi:hypothetical protein SAMN03159507_03173 [Pseudomonas sp. NFACC32-1]|uniref:hypothetical protein n=1 Tax=Pseudomonas sp. NFACC32-1 TaxID=1566198 RepID=UPI00087640A8|nr:hypothetical protein [Pseudomonas sp. NFACC32-1]SCX65804.1 hypothetical protein SAMN03159507_03173 [Pseudomonas sp. NFACC32-1]
MAINRLLQLENGIGLSKVVVCTGLTTPAIIHPVVHGEPALTAQAFYYLDHLDSVAKVRFETEQDVLSDEKIEFLIDNYLFEYSKNHPESRMSFKVLEGKFWQDDAHDHYLLADRGLTKVFVADVLNDEAVHSIEAINPEDSVDLQDWDIGRNYIKDCLYSYIDKVTGVLEKKVMAIIMPSAGRDGCMGKMRVVKPELSLLDYDSAMALANISLSQISEQAKSASLGWRGDHSLPVERIVATKFHNPVMLSHYFSGLHELNALKSFVGFYNVLEYYFEEAPRILGEDARSEKLQLECVVKLLLTDQEIIGFIGSLGVEENTFIKSDLPTSSGIKISKYDATAGAGKDLARWLYEIRCAVVHSKKTRKGQLTPTFEPYTAESQSLRRISPVIRWLAVKCIEKDGTLNSY